MTGQTRANLGTLLSQDSCEGIVFHQIVAVLQFVSIAVTPEKSAFVYYDIQYLVAQTDVQIYSAGSSDESLWCERCQTPN